MKVYGITGGAGTGKSEVIKMLQQNFGGCVIMSDEVARELMQKGNISYQLIVEYFGRDILMDDGEIDRKKLADQVEQYDASVCKGGDTKVDRRGRGFR